jgi:hypothetical protein
MSGHPLLTTNVYIGIVVVFIAIMLYWFFYNRRVRSKQSTLDEKGRLPVSKEEGIADGTKSKRRP